MNTLLPELCTDEQRALDLKVKRDVPIRTLHERGLDKRQTPDLGDERTLPFSLPNG